MNNFIIPGIIIHQSTFPHSTFDLWCQGKMEVRIVLWDQCWLMQTQLFYLSKWIIDVLQMRGIQRKVITGLCTEPWELLLLQHHEYNALVQIVLWWAIHTNALPTLFYFDQIKYRRASNEVEYKESNSSLWTPWYRFTASWIKLNGPDSSLGVIRYWCTSNVLLQYKM